MGFMIVTAFLSMWISNTATTAMMLPISQAVLEQLSATEADSDEKELREGQDNQAFELTEVNIKHPLDNVTGDKSNSKSNMLTFLKHFFFSAAQQINIFVVTDLKLIYYYIMLNCRL